MKLDSKHRPAHPSQRWPTVNFGTDAGAALMGNVACDGWNKTLDRSPDLSSAGDYSPRSSSCEAG